MCPHLVTFRYTYSSRVVNHHCYCDATSSTSPSAWRQQYNLVFKLDQIYTAFGMIADCVKCMSWKSASGCLICV